MSLVRSVLAIVFLAYLFLALSLPMLVLMSGFLLLAPFSENAFLNLACWMQGVYFHNLVFLLENVSGIQLRVTGAEPRNEGALVLSNHLTHDWVGMYTMACRVGALPYVRTVIKKSMGYIPFFGWGMHLCYWPFVSRDFKRDEKVLAKLFRSYQKAKLPVQLWLYPEGTRQTPKKLKESQEYAKEKGYPVWKHIMLPRHRGFCTAINSLRGVVSIIHEITLSYEGWGKARRSPPSFWQIINTDLSKRHVVHLHLNRYEMKSVPTDEEGQKKWLMESFGRKEVLLESYAKNGKFPGENLVKPYSLFTVLKPVAITLIANSIYLYLLVHFFW